MMDFGDIIPSNTEYYFYRRKQAIQVNYELIFYKRYHAIQVKSKISINATILDFSANVNNKFDPYAGIMALLHHSILFLQKTSCISSEKQVINHCNIIGFLSERQQQV
eukprot:939206_1